MNDIPSFFKRFQGNTPGRTVGLYVRFLALPTIACLWAYYGELVIKPGTAQMLGAGVAVFSALFFAVLVPLAEQWRLSRLKPAFYPVNYSEFIGHVLRTIYVGLWVALICFSGLLALSIWESEDVPGPWYVRLVTVLTTGACVIFTSLVVDAVKDTFCAYGESGQDVSK